MSYEYTVLQKPNLILYQIPPLASAKGHYLDTWKDMIWNGNLKVVSKNGNLTISFLNNDGSCFAVCPVPHRWEEAIQKTVDSSRGFAIRLQNPNGKYAWVGLAFRDRNDAFDFNVCFSDYEQKRELEANPNKFAKDFENMQDFSIKEGQKLVLNLGIGENKGNEKQQAKQKTNLSDFKFSMPLPGQNPTNKPEVPKQIPTNTTNMGTGTFGFDQGFNNWGSTANQNTQKTNDFSDFSSFNFGGSTQKPNQNTFSGPAPTQSFGNTQAKQNKPAKESENLLDL